MQTQTYKGIQYFVFSSITLIFFIVLNWFNSRLHWWNPDSILMSVLIGYCSKKIYMLYKFICKAQVNMIDFNFDLQQPWLNNSNLCYEILLSNQYWKIQCARIKIKLISYIHIYRLLIKLYTFVIICYLLFMIKRNSLVLISSTSFLEIIETIYEEAWSNTSKW